MGANLDNIFKGYEDTGQACLPLAKTPGKIKPEGTLPYYGHRAEEWADSPNGRQTLGVLTVASLPLAASPQVARASKLGYHLTADIVKETARWYKNVYWPQLKKGEPMAVAFGLGSAYEAANMGASAYNGDVSGVATSALSFLGMKYAYIGYTYRKPIAQTVQAVRDNPHRRDMAIDLMKSGTKLVKGQVFDYVVSGKPNFVGAYAEHHSSLVNAASWIRNEMMMH